MKHKKKVLSNGLRVITVPMPANQTVTVMVLAQAGSDYETKEQNGLSHFLEHMCFKGTLKRPTTADISEELDGMGADYNAFTSSEYTGYYAKGSYRHAERLLDIVADIYLNSTFPVEEIEKERGVIIEEINMYADQPRAILWDEFNQLLYGDQPAGRTTLGPKENIRKFTREDFVQYHQDFYTPGATTVVVAGNFDEQKINKQIKEYFGVMPTSPIQEKPKVKESQKAPAIRVKYRKGDQAHIVLGFRSFNLYDDRTTTAKVLATILGSGMSSRLFKRLREELGAAYYVYATNDFSLDHGMFNIAAGIDVKRAPEIISEILQLCQQLRDEVVPAKELKRAKDSILGSLSLALESSDSFAQYYGFQELTHDQIESPNQVARKIKAVTDKDIQKLARLLFKDSKMNLAVVGPYKGDDKFKNIFRIS